MRYYPHCGRYVFLTCFYFLAHFIYSQDSLQTLLLDEVEILGLETKTFMTGTTQQEFTDGLLWNPSMDLAEVLRQQSSIFIKSYGLNQLSTISIRGTGAGHTSVLWNGLSINSPTLGQSDLSQIPTFVTEQVILQKGGASALFGNESIGGALVMRNAPEWNVKPTIYFYQDMGSFHSFNSRASYRFGSQRFESSTKVYVNIAKNDFTYKNILKPGKPDETQLNANGSFWGFLQELHFKTGASGQIDANLWVHSALRNIQPSIAAPDIHDVQEDLNTRVSVSYKNGAKWGTVGINAGYQAENMLYNNSSSTTAYTYSYNSSYSKKVTSKISLESGLGIKKIQVVTDNYRQNEDEYRGSAFLWLAYTPLSQLEFSANIRKEMIPNYKIPFAPSLGASLALYQRGQNKLTWNLASSRNYRIPTLNDRFWNPGGNPNLQPETSFSMETGLEMHAGSDKTIVTGKLTAYKMWVDDWILWLPSGNIWVPQNIRKVEASGFEASVDLLYSTNRLDFPITIGYSFTRSLIKSTTGIYDRSYNKQLPFVPLHNAFANAGVKWKEWEIRITGNYTGKRYITTDNETSLDGYFLLDTDLRKSIQRNSITSTLGLRLQNLTNAAYFVLPFRAMPGINYQAFLTIKF